LILFWFVFVSNLWIVKILIYIRNFRCVFDKWLIWFKKLIFKTFVFIIFCIWKWEEFREIDKLEKIMNSFDYIICVRHVIFDSLCLDLEIKNWDNKINIIVLHEIIILLKDLNFNFDNINESIIKNSIFIYFLCIQVQCSLNLNIKSNCKLKYRLFLWDKFCVFSKKI